MNVHDGNFLKENNARHIWHPMAHPADMRANPPKVIVAAEGASAGALPLLARHSGLAEVAEALETQVGHPGLFSFEPGAGAVDRIGEGIGRLLSLPVDERRELGEALSGFVRGHWTWERTAAALLEAATSRPHPA